MRAIRYLHRTIPFWKQDSARISSARYLSEKQRDVLRPLVRAWVVRYTTVRFSMLRYATQAANIAAPVVCLLGPIGIVAAVPAARTLSGGGLFLALMTYFTIFGIIATCFFEWIANGLFALLSSLGVGISIVAASVTATLVVNPLKAMQFGVLAGIFAMPVIAAIYLAGIVIGPYIWFPIQRRYLATLPPSLATAVLLWYLTDHVNDSLATWRQTKTRRKLLNEIENICYWLTVRMPRAMWMAGYRGLAYSEARRRYQYAGSFVRDQEWLMIDAGDRESLEAIRNDLLDKAIAVARGDWTVLPNNIQKRSSRSWLLTVLRRLIAAIVLAGAALLLPHLPDIRLTGSALTSLQVGLLVTAALSLTPIDASSRGKIIGAFTDPRDYH